MFNKAPSSISGPNDDVVVPPGSTKLDWEVEIAVAIGDPGIYIDEADAVKHIAGYCICNDVSERAWQTEGTGHWVKGKSAPTFGPRFSSLTSFERAVTPRMSRASRRGVQYSWQPS